MAPKKKPTILLSIDPGYDRIGWAVAEVRGNQYKLLACQCLQTNRKSKIFERYQEITEGLRQIISQYQPTEAAIESVFFSVNRKTALRVSEARGVIISALISGGLDISEYNPNEIKLAVTGHGQADKRAVAKMVRLQTGLATKELIDDAVDAVAVGMTHALTAGLRRTKAALGRAVSS